MRVPAATNDPPTACFFRHRGVASMSTVLLSPVTLQPTVSPTPVSWSVGRLTALPGATGSGTGAGGPGWSRLDARRDAVAGWKGFRS